MNIHLRILPSKYKTTLKNRRNPTSLRENTVNTCQSLGLIFPCNKVLMVDPEFSIVIRGSFSGVNTEVLGVTNSTLPEKISLERPRVHHCPYHPWDWYIYLHENHVLPLKQPNVGKYTSPMDGMGC